MAAASTATTYQLSLSEFEARLLLTLLQTVVIKDTAEHLLTPAESALEDIESALGEKVKNLGPDITFELV